MKYKVWIDYAGAEVEAESEDAAKQSAVALLSACMRPEHFKVEEIFEDCPECGFDAMGNHTPGCSRAATAP